MDAVIMITIALAFNLLDIVSGVISALKSGEGLKSSKLRDGIFKKAGFILLYLLSWGLDFSRTYIDIPINIDILPVIIVYVVLTEIVSVIENIAEINPDILPEKIKKIIGITEE